jgi:type 1 glutamine amidotransferase
MDSEPPVLPRFTREHVKTANAALQSIVQKKGWDPFVTENAAVFNPEALAKFDVIVLNSTSGNIWTDDQRAAFRQWLEKGGGLVALHGAGGDPHYDWKWYVDVVIGAQFIGHTNKPQFPQGVIRIAEPEHPAMRGLPAEWRREEEWYAFNRMPSGYNTKILARLDEKSYEPPAEQRMGDHPIIWTRCIGRGPVFYSALGHKAETYSEPLHLQMIDGALSWAAQSGRGECT